MNDIPEGFELAPIPEGFEEVADKSAPTKKEKGFLRKAGDWALGAGEAGLSIASSIPAGVYGPLVGIAQRLQGTDMATADKMAGQAMQANTYAPRSEEGQAIMEPIGEFMNRYAVPFGAVAHTMPRVRMAPSPKAFAEQAHKEYLATKPGEIPKTPTEPTAAVVKTAIPEGFEEVVKDQDTPMQKQLAIREAMDKREQAYADQRNVQGELDLRPKQLPLDENGMPVDMARSLDVQEATRPEQIDLFNEDFRAQAEMQRARDLELAQQREAALKAEMEQSPVSRAAPEEIEAAYAQRQRQMFDEAEASRQAAKDEVLTQMEQQLRENAYKPTGDGQGPKTRAFKSRGNKQSGMVAMASDMEALKTRFQKFAVEVEPTKFGDTPSVMVRLKTPDGKLSGFVDFAIREDGTLVAENAQVSEGLRGNGAAQRMYLAAREAGYDIAPGRVQTDLGNKMVASLQKRGLINKEALGPRFSAGDLNLQPLAGEQLPGSKYRVPQSQRGAIDFSSPEPKNKPALTKESPEIVAAAAELKKQQRSQVIGNILHDPVLDAYTARIDTPEKVISLALDGAKDIGATQAAKAHTISPGMNAVAISSNNPLLRYTRDAISKVVRQTEQLTRQYVTGKDGFGDKLKKLSQAEKNEVVAVLQEADKRQAAANIEGLSPAQKALVEHIQKMDDVKLDIWNKVRTDLGLPLVTKRMGHFAGNFAGDYRTLVLDKEGNVVGVIGTDTLLGNKHVQKLVAEKQPGVKFADTKRVALSGSKARASMFNGFADIMDVLAKDDPRFAKIQEVVDAAIKDRGDSLYGAALHAKQKKGVWGNEGNKFWKDRNTNTNEALKAFVNYWEEGIASHLNLPTEVKLKELMDSPALDGMPRAKKYVNDYINNFTGRSLGTVGDALNAIIDTPARLTGLGSSVVREAVQQFNKRASQFTMGFLNPLFLATQYLQVPQLAMPELLKITGSLGNGQKLGLASAKAVSDGLKIAHEELTGKPAHVDNFARAAYQYAKDAGLLSFSEYANARDIFQNKASKAFDAVADFTREKAEQTTRPYVFFVASELLKDSGLSPKEIFDTAYNITQHSMINYHTSEKPLMYGRLGVVGQAAGSLQTFKHAYLGVLGTMANEAARGRPGPLIGAAAALFAFAGIKGVPFYQELDELYKSISDKYFRDRKSIADSALKNLPEWAKSGVLSTSTGVNMQGRLSAADVLPNSPMEAISPFGSWAGKVVEGVGDVASNNDALAWSNLATAVAPSGTLKGITEDVLKTNEQGQTINKRGEVDYPRTEFDRDLRRFTGGTSLDESLNKSRLYDQTVNMRSRREGQSAVTKKAQRALAQGTLTEEGMKALMEEYTKEKGDPQQLVNALIEFAKTKNMTTKQRLQGVPSGSLSSVNQYLNYSEAP